MTEVWSVCSRKIPDVFCDHSDNSNFFRVLADCLGHLKHAMWTVSLTQHIKRICSSMFGPMLVVSRNIPAAFLLWPVCHSVEECAATLHIWGPSPSNSYTRGPWAHVFFYPFIHIQARQNPILFRHLGISFECKIPKWLKCPPSDKTVKWMWYVHIMVYYLAIKKGMKDWYVEWYGRNLKTLCWLKEANHKRPHISSTWNVQKRQTYKERK